MGYSKHDLDRMSPAKRDKYEEAQKNMNRERSSLRKEGISIHKHKNGGDPYYTASKNGESIAGAYDHESDLIKSLKKK
jgi:hypothetical protein